MLTASDTAVTSRSVTPTPGTGLSATEDKRALEASDSSQGIEASSFTPGMCQKTSVTGGKKKKMLPLAFAEKSVPPDPITHGGEKGSLSL